MHKIWAPQWVGRQAFYRFDTINPLTAALLCVDMQVAFVEPGQPFAMAHAAEVAANTNRIAAALRQAGGTIVFTRHTVSDEAPWVLPAFQREVPAVALSDPIFRPGGPGHALDASLDCRAEDAVVDKYRMNAFMANSSDLHQRLQQRGVDTLIVTGIATNVCCESSARDASMLGYRVFFISDATATRTDEEHNAALLNVGAIFADVRSTEGMLALLRDAATNRQREVST